MIAIEVRVRQMTGLQPRLHERPCIGARLHDVRHIERALCAVILIGAPNFVVLRLPEVGQHVFITPPGDTLRSPSLVVGATSPYVLSAVDRAAPAEGFSAWLVADAT